MCSSWFVGGGGAFSSFDSNCDDYNSSSFWGKKMGSVLGLTSLIRHGRTYVYSYLGGCGGEGRGKHELSLSVLLLLV